MDTSGYLWIPLDTFGILETCLFRIDGWALYATSLGTAVRSESMRNHEHVRPHKDVASKVSQYHLTLSLFLSLRNRLFFHSASLLFHRETLWCPSGLQQTCLKMWVQRSLSSTHSARVSTSDSVSAKAATCLFFKSGKAKLQSTVQVHMGDLTVK